MSFKEKYFLLKKILIMPFNAPSMIIHFWYMNGYKTAIFFSLVFIYVEIHAMVIF